MAEEQLEGQHHWPAVPHSRNGPVFPPSPVSPGAESTMSEETLSRSRLAAEEEGLRPIASKYRPPTPAVEKADPVLEQSRHVASSPPRVAALVEPKSSRFSADSAASDDNGKASIMSRSIRKLWRKSGAAAQATVKLNAARQNAGRGASPPPPLPTTATSSSTSMSASSAIMSGRSDSRHGRPDSGLDPFYFDQQSRYPTMRAPSPTTAPGKHRPAQSRDVPVPKQLATGQSSKTRSILKGRKTPPLPSAQSSPVLEEYREPATVGLFQRRRSNTVKDASPPLPAPEDKERPLPFFQRRKSNAGPNDFKIVRSDDVASPADPSRDDAGPRPARRKSPPASLAQQSNLLPVGRLSNFPRTASSRASFDIDETTYRPSLDSGDPYTPRLSQFEIVSPPTRPFELEEEDLKSTWMR